MIDTPRLDILLYAHDGRGLGHVSRAAAIGLALRRLFPELRVLLVTGANVTQELIGAAPFDWLKLPSYATRVINGKSRGITGKSNFKDDELGRLRGEQIRQIIATYRPLVVLADHSPQGKHRELLPALEAGEKDHIHWVLGVRGVVGRVKQVGSDLAASTFKKYYSSLFWYGDTRVLGREQLAALASHFGSTPHECGYVSGLRERVESLTGQGPQHNLSGTIAIPWFSERTPAFLQHLFHVVEKAGNAHSWHIYLDPSHPESSRFHELFGKLPNCRIEPPGRRYLDSLLSSRCAIVYGGYNSLMDVLSLGLPALIVLRDMEDNEQQLHLATLREKTEMRLETLEESCGGEELAEAFDTLLSFPEHLTNPLNLDGAATAAKLLASLVEKKR